MSQEKQIEEMAIELGVYACKKTPCRNCAVDTNCIWLDDANRLYNLGYRKASDVAREIFEEIEKLLGRYYLEWQFCHYDGYPIEGFSELKKKYTEGGE